MYRTYFCTARTSTSQQDFVWKIANFRDFHENSRFLAIFFSISVKIQPNFTFFWRSIIAEFADFHLHINIFKPDPQADILQHRHLQQYINCKIFGSPRTFSYFTVVNCKFCPTTAWFISLQSRKIAFFQQKKIFFAMLNRKNTTLFAFSINRNTSKNTLTPRLRTGHQSRKFGWLHCR